VSNAPIGFVDSFGFDYTEPPNPGGGSIDGYPPDGWVGDGTGKLTFCGTGSKKPAPKIDVDFILVDGVWYKIQGAVYMLPSG
jgi:hypothetical protein